MGVDTGRDVKFVSGFWAESDIRRRGIFWGLYISWYDFVISGILLVRGYV